MMREKDLSGNQRRRSQASETPRSIMDGRTLDKLKRRAADFGLIIFQRGDGSAKPKGGKQRGGGKS